MDFFYRNHRDMANNTLVSVLTEAGLAEYFEIRKLEEPELTKNMSLIIDYDVNATPEFSKNMQNEIKTTLLKSSDDKRSDYVIHRDVHTVSLIREKNKFLLLDSYNAHGTKDMEHIPLLKIIRELFPTGEIYTLHDKMQKDYYNCRIFSIENLIEIERFCKFHKCDLSDVIESNKDICFYNFDSDKEKFYKELNVNPIGTPLPIIPKIQSIRQIEKITKEFKVLKFKRTKFQTYFDYLVKNIKIDNNGKAINYTIENQSIKIKKQISFLQKIIKMPNGKDKDYIMQKSFVNKLKINNEIKNIHYYSGKN